jgi:hypothetical protein
MIPFIEAARKRGVHVTLIDVVETPRLYELRPDLIDEKYNLCNDEDKKRFWRDALNEEIDLTYIASLPEAHLFNLIDLETVSRCMLVTKPLTVFKHMPALKDRFKPPAAGGAADQGWYLADHFTTKPIVQAVERILPSSHQSHGRFRKMLLILTEKKSVNEELARRDALSVGQLQDMGSHGIAVLQRLVPKGLSWNDQYGNRITRVDREIKVWACVELQNNNAPFNMKDGQETVSTAVLLELLILEQLVLTGPDGSTFHCDNEFRALILAGKGFVGDPARPDRDLKGIEVGYQDGATGTIDLESNAGGGVYDPTGTDTTLASVRHHRGVCLPLLRMLDSWDRDEPLTLGQDFLDSASAWENQWIQYHGWNNAGQGRRVLGYGSAAGPESVQDFINAFAVARYGFSDGWHLSKPPLHLIFGTVPQSPTA